MSEYEKIKRLAEAATPQDFDSAQEVREDFEIDCPICGEGYVEVSADYCNYDGVPLGVQFYGIGQEHMAAEAYYRAMNPAKAVEIISQLTAANARVEALEWAAKNRLSEGHNEACKEMSPEGPCVCGHDTLEALLRLEIDDE